METSPEICKFVPEWADCLKEADGFVAAHSLIVLWRGMKYQEFKVLSSKD